jgi:hypothetical protein
MVEGSSGIDGLRTKIGAEWPAGVYQAGLLLLYRPGYKSYIKLISLFTLSLLAIMEQILLNLVVSE